MKTSLPFLKRWQRLWDEPFGKRRGCSKTRHGYFSNPAWNVCLNYQRQESTRRRSALGRPWPYFSSKMEKVVSRMRSRRDNRTAVETITVQVAGFSILERPRQGYYIGRKKLITFKVWYRRIRQIDQLWWWARNQHCRVFHPHNQNWEIPWADEHWWILGYI